MSPDDCAGHFDGAEVKARGNLTDFRDKQTYMVQKRTRFIKAVFLYFVKSTKTQLLLP